MKDSLKSKMKEKIEELEVEAILQKELLEVLESMEVSGREAAELGQKIQMLKSNTTFSDEYIEKLRNKYLDDE